MNRLSRRVKRLETASSVHSGCYDFDLLQRTALNKLSVSDRELLTAALATRDVSELVAARPDLWESWNTAISEATIETGFPIKFDAGDLLL